MQSSMSWSRLGTLCLLLFFATAPRAEPHPIDVSEFEKDLIVLKGPQGHYMVTSLERMRWRTFWGSSETVYQLTGQQMDEKGEPGSYTMVYSYFFDARITGSFKLKWQEGTWSLHCSEQDVELREIPQQEAAEVLDKVEFRSRYFARNPILLARDEYGTYYLVDEDLYDDSPENLHVYSGWMGNMVKSKMHLVARDTEGSIFSTRSGDRRLIMDEEMYRYVEDEVSRPLRKIPVNNNRPFIHGDLGVYADMKRGTPCDLFY
jgi:hypothetical protein